MTNFLQRLLGRKPKPTAPAWVPSPAQLAEFELGKLLMSAPEAYLDYIRDNADETGHVDVPLMGTYVHFQAITLLLQRGGSVQSILLTGAIDTVDYTPELINEMSKLLCNRLTNGYPEAEYMNFHDNEDAAQHAIRNFALSARGWTGTDANGRVYIVDGANRPAPVGPNWEARLAEMQAAAA